MRLVNGGVLTKSFVKAVIGRSCLATDVADCERRPRLDLNDLPISAGEIGTRAFANYDYATRTISTEQWARAATADDTLPVRSLSTRPTPLAPTKMLSAFQPSASLSSNAFGSSSFTMTDVRSPACLSF